MRYRVLAVATMAVAWHGVVARLNAQTAPDGALTDEQIAELRDYCRPIDMAASINSDPLNDEEENCRFILSGVEFPAWESDAELDARYGPRCRDIPCESAEWCRCRDGLITSDLPDGDGGYYRQIELTGPDGDTVYLEQDSDRDGIPELRVQNERTTDGGRIVDGQFDEDEDGEVERRVIALYDADDRLTETRDILAKDSDQTVSVVRYVYDGESRIEEQRDSNGDTLLDELCRYSPPCGPPYEGCASQCFAAQ